MTSVYKKDLKTTGQLSHFKTTSSQRSEKAKKNWKLLEILRMHYGELRRNRRGFYYD